MCLDPKPSRILTSSLIGLVVKMDRIPVVKGEIRLADRAYLQPARMANVIEAGADVVIRAGWKSARWVDEAGNAIDVVAELRDAEVCGLLDQPMLPAPFVMANPLLQSIVPA